MTRPQGYQRFGLVRNPFQDLASDTLDDATLVHVNQQVDGVLREIVEDVLDQKRKAVVALIGPLGAGKTHRLVVAGETAREAEALSIYHPISVEAPYVVQGIVEAIQEQSDLGAFGRLVNTPKWYRQLSSIRKQVRKKYDPERVGQALAEALNANAPAFLLLNDLQNLEGSDEADRFMATLHALQNHIRPGVLVMFSCYPEYFQRLQQRHTAVTTRIDRRVLLQGLSASEASLLIGKRFLASRVVDDLDPLYPFTPEAIALMAEVAKGNPRRLLKLASRVLEHATAGRAYHVDAEQVRALLPQLGVGGPTEPPVRAVSSRPVAAASGGATTPVPSRPPA